MFLAETPHKEHLVLWVGNYQVFRSGKTHAAVHERVYALMHRHAAQHAFEQVEEPVRLLEKLVVDVYAGTADALGLQLEHDVVVVEVHFAQRLDEGPDVESPVGRKGYLRRRRECANAGKRFVGNPVFHACYAEIDVVGLKVVQIPGYEPPGVFVEKVQAHEYPCLAIARYLGRMHCEAVCLLLEEPGLPLL